MKAKFETLQEGFFEPPAKTDLKETEDDLTRY